MQTSVEEAVRQHHHDTISQIKNWFETAIPDPTDENLHLQVGVHIEEVAEMFAALFPIATSQKMSETMEFVHNVLEYTQKRLKSHEQDAKLDFTDINREEMLDALCDQIVTAVGLAHMMKLDILGGLKEVANSNDSKFDADGLPIFDRQLKIQKGPSYFRADLSKYV